MSTRERIGEDLLQLVFSARSSLNFGDQGVSRGTPIKYAAPESSLPITLSSPPSFRYLRPFALPRRTLVTFVLGVVGVAIINIITIISLKSLQRAFNAAGKTPNDTKFYRPKVRVPVLPVVLLNVLCFLNKLKCVNRNSSPSHR